MVASGSVPPICTTQKSGRGGAGGDLSPGLPPPRRDVLGQLAALVALPLVRPLARWTFAADDPLDGTIADYQAGRRRGAWTAAEITARALDRCHADGARWRAIDALADASLDEARAAAAPFPAAPTLGAR